MTDMMAAMGETEHLIAELRKPSGIGEPHDHALMRRAADYLEHAAAREAKMANAMTYLILAAVNSNCDSTAIDRARAALSGEPK